MRRPPEPPPETELHGACLAQAPLESNECAYPAHLTRSARFPGPCKNKRARVSPGARITASHSRQVFVPCVKRD